MTVRGLVLTTGSNPSLLEISLSNRFRVKATRREGISPLHACCWVSAERFYQAEEFYVRGGGQAGPRSMVTTVELHRTGCSTQRQICDHAWFSISQIFQLVGAEFGTNSDAQVILLLLLCVIAPVWAFGAGMMVSTDPQQQRTQPRCARLLCLLPIPIRAKLLLPSCSVARLYPMLVL